MSILTPIKGIYYSIGSKDIPQSYNFYDKYGFDGDDPEPVFSYSLMNVNDFFIKPLNSMRLKDNEIQTLITESVPFNGLEGLSKEDFENNGFKALFEAFHILYDRSDVTDPDIVYDSKGDRLLSEASLENRYKAGSLYMELAIIKEELRISLVKFKFKLYDNADHTDIMIYFIPDVMFEREGLEEGRYNITYTTKGVNNDEAGLTDIVAEGGNSLLHLERNRNYSNVCKLTTTFNVLDENHEEILDTYNRTFFIHNILYTGYEISTYDKIVLVKKYLNYIYSSYGDEKRIILHREYPELFTANTVDIFPMLTPRIENENRSSSVISNDQIRNEIQRRGVTIDLDDEDSAKRVEVIMLEGIGVFDNNDYSTLSMSNKNFLTPLIIISNDPSITIGVIYDTFPSFAPVFTGYEVHGETWEQFQIILKLIVKLATGILPWRYSGISDQELSNILNIPVKYLLSTERATIYESEFINSISFNFLDVTYTVHNFYRYGVFEDE